MSERPIYATFDGLDATGKSKLIELIQRDAGAQVVKTPPEWMRPIRSKFDNTTKIETRFLYYSFGNVWVDRFQLRPKLANSSEGIILQDRSWLSTLSAHEARGLSPCWLRIGALIARCCQKPDVPIILHVEANERHKRLAERGLCNRTDQENLLLENQMESGYIRWAHSIDWTPQMFDNTSFSEEEAKVHLLDIIRRS
jgi:thymidylate kinase